MSNARTAPLGSTRTCPHCKAVILESASVCPGCRHHLRYDRDVRPGGTAAQRVAWRVEGTLAPDGENLGNEYSIIISVRNERNEEVTRQIVNVGALSGAQRRMFALTVEVSPPQAMSAPRRK